MKPGHTITPMQLEILLHYSYSHVPYKNRVAVSHPANMVLEQEQLLEARFLLETYINDLHGFKLSGAGKLFVEHILSTPLPERGEWFIPERSQ